MAFIIHDSKELFDLWRSANKYSADDFHAMNIHRINGKENDCSEQYHVLSTNMGDGKCSVCGKSLNSSDLNFKHKG